MDTEFTKAGRTLVVELNREAASGLISRKALIALDRVQRLLEAETTLRGPAAQESVAKIESYGVSA